MVEETTYTTNSEGSMKIFSQLTAFHFSRLVIGGRKPARYIDNLKKVIPKEMCTPWDQGKKVRSCSRMRSSFAIYSEQIWIEKLRS